MNRWTWPDSGIISIALPEDDLYVIKARSVEAETADPHRLYDSCVHLHAASADPSGHSRELVFSSGQVDACQLANQCQT